MSQLTMDPQQELWNKWNAKFLSDPGDEARRRRDEVLKIVNSLNLKNPRILEIGCGNGWAAQSLTRLGEVTGIDIADESIEQAKVNVPHARFMAGDFCEMAIPAQSYDLIVTFETFSHVSNQDRFLELVSKTVKPGGRFVITTQNKAVYSRKKKGPGYVADIRRNFVTPQELKAMVGKHMRVEKCFTIEPKGNLGIFRIANSVKLNRIVSFFLGVNIPRGFKEKMGWGQTIIAVARNR